MPRHLTLDEQKYGTEVRLKPYIPREPLHYELMTDDEIVAGQGGTLIVDCEVYPNYFLVAFKDIKTKKIIIIELSNHLNIESMKLSWIMNSYRTIGFYSLKFDIPLIWLAYQNPIPEIIKEAANKLILENMFPSQLQKEYNYKIHQTNHIDLIEVCPLTGSLKLYGARLHAPRIQELPFAHNKLLHPNQIPIVRDYCINDLDTTELIFDNLSEQLTLRESLSIQYKQNLMSKSDAQIAEAVICGELKRLTGKWPKRPEQQIGNVHQYKVPSFIFFQTERLQKLLNMIAKAHYQVLENGRVIIPKEIENADVYIGDGPVYHIGNGGLHSSEKTTCVHATSDYSLIDRDVSSYYPRIILNCKLYPQHLGENFLTVYNAIVERRLIAKTNKNIIEAEGLKITINGTFGKMGSPYSVLYAPDLMIQVTVTGQLALLMLIERLELEDINIVSANTDGIMIKCHKDKIEQMNAITKMWEQITGFTTEETEYDSLYSRDVNAFLAVKKDGKSKGKNIYYDPWGTKDAKDLIWRLHKNPNTQICTEAAIKFITQNISIEKTIRECRDITRFVAVKNVTGGAHKNGHYLGKVIRWAYFENERGTINYVKNNNLVPDTLGACPLMDLPSEFPSDLNYTKYIEKTLDMLRELSYIPKSNQLELNV